MSHCPSCCGLRFLIIDDEPMLLTLMEDALTALGFEVSTTPDGERGPAAWRSNSFDAVVCDFDMPGLDGATISKRIKSARKTADKPKTPFILVTGWTDRELDITHPAQKMSAYTPASSNPLNYGH
jgi:DNA-binding response OmpR family regulator